jgi:hypothetical protein
MNPPPRSTRAAVAASRRYAVEHAARRLREAADRLDAHDARTGQARAHAIAAATATATATATEDNPGAVAEWLDTVERLRDDRAALVEVVAVGERELREVAAALQAAEKFHP